MPSAPGVACANMVQTTWLPPDEYYRTLPRFICSAGMILRNTDNETLIVQTNYGRCVWEIPGGGLAHGEMPYATAVREINEELGLHRPAGRLLVVDLMPAQNNGQPPLANFLFDGGILATEDIAALILDPREIAQIRWCVPAEYHELLAPHLARRLDACHDALTNGTSHYLHEGHPPA